MSLPDTDTMCTVPASDFRRPRHENETERHHDEAEYFHVALVAWEAKADGPPEFEDRNVTYIFERFAIRDWK